MQIKQKIKATYHERELPYVIGNNCIIDQIEQEPALIFVNNMPPEHGLVMMHTSICQNM